MRDRVSDFKLGLFILLGGGLLTALTVMFGAGVFSPKGIMIETYIDGTVQGLEVGSPVKYRGVRIGTVDEINLVDRYYDVGESEFAHYIYVRMELDPGVQRLEPEAVRERIRNWTEKGMRLKVSSQGITGVAYVEAEFVKSEDDQPLEITWEPNDLYIPSARTQFAILADTIEGIAKDLKNANLPQIASDIEQLLSTMNEAVEDANIQKVSEGVTQSLEEIQSMVANVEKAIVDSDIKSLGTKAANSIDELSATAAEIRTSVNTATEGLSELLAETNKAVVDAREYLNNPEVEEAIGSISRLSNEVAQLVNSFEDALALKNRQVDLILSDLRGATANLRDFANLLSRYPSFAAFGDAPTQSEVYEK